MTRPSPLQRALVLAVFAVTGTVAAIASIAPDTDAALLLNKHVLPEPVTIGADALLPAPAAYIREERFLAGDTLAAMRTTPAAHTGIDRKNMGFNYPLWTRSRLNPACSRA